MAFTVDDFEDLYRLLAERPEWRERLRPLILGDEFLEIPARLERIEQLLEQIVERQAAFEERQAAFEANMIAFGERQAAFEERQAAFEERQAAFEAGLAALLEASRTHERRLNLVEGRLANLEGSDLENRYFRHYRNWLADHLYRARQVYLDELDLLESAITAGTITREEVRPLRHLDLLLRGTLPDGSGREALLALEASYTIHADDIERVTARAGVLRRAGYEVIAVVGGYRIEPETEALAQTAGVLIDLHRAPSTAVA